MPGIFFIIQAKCYAGNVSSDNIGFWRFPPQKANFAIQIIAGNFPGTGIISEHGKFSWLFISQHWAGRGVAALPRYPAPLPAAISMEVNRIFFYSKRGRLSEVAAMEVDFDNFKENFSRAAFRVFGNDLYPSPALAALRQIFAVRGNLDSSHPVLSVGPGA